MTITWGTLRQEIYDALLKDTDGAKYDPEQMKVWAKWAVIELSMHTAEPAQVLYPCDGATWQFLMPDRLVDNIEKAGLVGVNDGANIDWLVSMRQDPNEKFPVNIPDSTSKVKGFWEWPSRHLTLSYIPRSGSLVVINHFRIWAAPQSDDDEMTFPYWMQEPFAYFVGAAAMGPKGVSASDIRQWNRKTDSGNPEHNPLHRQADFFLAQAKRLMDKQGPQDRENFYQVRGNSWQSR